MGCVNCEKDYFHEGKQLYGIHRVIDSLDNRPFNDGSHIIYVNFGKIHTIEDMELEKLREDFYCKEPEKIHSRVLREEVKRYKESEGDGMKLTIDNVFRSGKIEGRA